MSEDLPHFKYHPDPVRTGYIEPRDDVCVSCERARGYVYTGPPTEDEEDIQTPFCPWCIADGSAAEKFEIEFCDTYALERAGIAENVVDEVMHRTPGFFSWQGQHWLSHCNDACEFHGDLPKERFADVSEEDRAAIMATLPVNWTWESIQEFYEPGGQPGIYWFICRHCSKHLYYADYT